MPTRFLPSVSKPLAGLLLVLLAPLALAQQSASGLSDSERAKRDANKVLSFIKFHAVRAPRPVAAPAAAPVAAVAAVAQAQVAPRPRATPAVARDGDGLQAAAQEQGATPKATAAMGTAALAGERPGITLPPVSEPQPQVQPVEPLQPQPSPVPVEPEPEPEAEELVELKLIEHVQPELPRGNGLRDGSVRVRFTVMPDGSVQKVTTNASAQRRLATAASRAVQQWRFEAIQEATEVEVDIDFRFD